MATASWPRSESPAMRLLPLVAIASLSVSSGCVLAVAPAVGAGAGLAIAGTKRVKHQDASFISHGAVGALIGVAIDALLVGALLYDLSNERWDLGDRTGAARSSTR